MTFIVERDGNVDVTQRAQLAAGGAAEEVGKQHPGHTLHRLAQGRQPFRHACGENPVAHRLDYCSPVSGWAGQRPVRS